MYIYIYIYMIYIYIYTWCKTPQHADIWVSLHFLAKVYLLQEHITFFFFLPGWQSCRLSFCVGSVGKLYFLQQRNKQLKQIRLQESRLNQSLKHILPKHRVVMKGLFPVFARLNHSLFSSKPPFIRTPHFQNHPEHFHAQGSRQFSFFNILSTSSTSSTSSSHVCRFDV